MPENIRPVLSIIMPSRNRAKYAESAIRSILSSKHHQFELVVQDNSDNTETKELMEAIDDPRLIYRHVPEPLDVVENFSQALDNSSGEYICFVGDDDAVNPEITLAAIWAKENDFDALLPTRPAHYWWPDLRFRYYGDKYSGSLDLTQFTAQLTFPDPETEMLKCVHRAGQDFCDLPKVYYGIVRREILDKVKAKTGTYFPGPSPDMAGAMSCANFVERMCKVDYPLFVPGSSAKSTAGLGAMKKHEGRLEDQRHLPKYMVADWSEIVPRFFAGSTIWGEDAVRALRLLGRQDVLDKFNIPRLHARCAVFNRPFMWYTIRHLYSALGHTKRSKLVGTVMFVWYLLDTWGLRVKSMARRLSFSKSEGKRMTISNLENIEDAVAALLAQLDKSGINFQNMVVDKNNLTD